MDSTNEKLQMTTHGPDLLLEYYDTPTRWPLSFDDWEDRARDLLPAEAFDYVAGGAGREDTVRANQQAFDRWRIRPRMASTSAQRDVTVRILGTESAGPFMLAPVGVQEILHPEAEVAAARGAAAAGIPTIVSTLSSTPLEEIAAAIGDAPRWFQLYPGTRPEVSQSLVKRAEAAGYAAIVVTLDTTLPGYRPRDLRRGYLPFLRGLGLANFRTDSVFLSGLSDDHRDTADPVVQGFLETCFAPALSWDDIARIRESTALPILIKGITEPEDARIARGHGAQGVIVSNHGGRQVDGAVAALDALPGVVAAVGDDVTVLVDSGVRSGNDMVKALSIGAAATLVGRPFAYALGVGGEPAVTHLMRQMLAEVDLALALSGHRSVADLGPDSVVETS